MTFYCPQCNGAVAEGAERCSHCRALFTIPGGWRPVQARHIQPLAVLGTFIVRTFVALFGCLIAVGWVVIDAIPYGGGGDRYPSAATAVFFLLGWVVLPFVRIWFVCGVAVAVLWITLGVLLLNTGWELMLGPFSVATAGLAACLFWNPPKYLQHKHQLLEDNDPPRGPAA